MARQLKARPTNSQIDAAIARGKLFWSAEPRAVSAKYDSRRDELTLVLNSGVRVAIPRRLLQGLEAASKRKVSFLVLEGSGTGLTWPHLGVDHYIPGLLRGVFGSRQWMARIGRKGGRAQSPAKVKAARLNGLKGGRPRSVA